MTPQLETPTQNKATGPRTPEGKAVSKLNSLKHGLTGEAALIPGEDPEEFHIHSSGIIASLKAETPLEQHLARTIAADYWRIERIRRLEQAHLAEAVDNETEPDAKRLNLYSLYESRLNRNIKNNMAELRQLQRERREAELIEFQALASRAVLDGQPLPPPPPGFVSSKAAMPSVEDIVESNLLAIQMRIATRQAAEAQAAAAEAAKTAAAPTQMAA
jgi:hypothetical protein